jgi:hypothetical protein
LVVKYKCWVGSLLVLTDMLTQHPESPFYLLNLNLW